MQPSAIVVVFDRLGSAYLGPYGNTWIETPAFNRLASQSLLWETALTDSPSLPTVYDGYWCGKPAICSVHDHAAAGMLPSQLAAAGVHSQLITDSRQVAELEAADQFSERLVLPADPPAQLPAGVDKTQLGQILGAAADFAARNDFSSLLWVHAKAMEGIWDAPLALRQQFREEGDPLPSTCLEPPNRNYGLDLDPDELLSLTHAYAGQVSLIDACLAVLLATIEELPPDRQPLLIVTSPRGFPLGERKRVGAAGDDLYGELLQVPLFARLPDGKQDSQRLSKLTQPVDLHQTLLDYFGAGPPDGWGANLLADGALPATAGSDFLCSQSEKCWALRTPIWFLRDTDPAELFVKPDDRWDVNEVADRCGEVVDALRAAIAAIRLAAQDDDPAKLPTLAAELITEVD